MRPAVLRIGWTLLTTSLLAGAAWACPGDDATSTSATATTCAAHSAKSAACSKQCATACAKSAHSTKANPATTTASKNTAAAKQTTKASTASSKQQKNVAKTVAKSSAPAASMRIFRDPETGEVGPPTAENARLMARQSPVEADRANLPQVNLGDGRGYMINTTQIEDAMVVKLDRNGHRVYVCTSDPKAALKAPAPAPATREDR